MSIYFGNDTVNDLYVGLTPVSKGYVGTHLFYDGDNTIIDTTYEKYILNTQFSTLYNTAEKPVKSAILKGQTLVNIAYFKEGLYNYTDYNLLFIDKTKSYFIKFNTTFETTQIGFIVDNNAWNVSKQFNATKNGYVIIKPDEAKDINALRVRFNGNTDKSFIPTLDLICIEYQEGMENWDIPYFEGMQSVKMPVLKTTGKNLFPTNNFLEYGTDNKMVGQDTFEVYLKSGDYCGSYVHADDSDKDTMLRYKLLDEQDNEVLGNSSVDRTFTIENNGLYKLRFGRGSAYSGKCTKIQVQLEEGSVATEYEPYKSNILTVNEPIELRGIRGVKDELNLITGELTKRIGEVVLDGSEDWIRSNMANSSFFYTSLNNLVHKTDYLNSISCDKFTVHANEATLHDSISPNGITAYADVTDTYPNENWLYIKYVDSEGSVEKFKQWLSQNPTTVQYELATESVKTVDLSVVDQDGNNTKLSTFDDITHVTLSSEGLIPEAELEVATKNEEVLNTMGLEMDDISTTQNALKETSNTQSENVDATMLATTEIYEGLL